MEEMLKGVSRETLHSAWGEPARALSSFSGEVFHIPESFTGIIVYYDEVGFVERIRIYRMNQAVSQAK